MSAPISLNSGSNQTLEGALIWRTEGLHYFYPGLPPENHSANAREKGGSLFCKTESPDWVSEECLHGSEDKERQEDRVGKQRVRW